MRKTLFSVLPLLVFLEPSYARLSSFFGLLSFTPTAARVADAYGRELQPLAVRYPVEDGGKLKEVAYYTSAHPSVESAEIVRAGRDYVHEKLNDAVARLASKGETISPSVVDVAERL